MIIKEKTNKEWNKRKENDFWNANKGKYHKSLRKDMKNENYLLRNGKEQQIDNEKELFQKWEKM